MMLLDANAVEVPRWLLIAAPFMTVMTGALGFGASFVRPWHDERWIRALARCLPAVEKALRTEVFAKDLAVAEARQRKIDAIEDAITGLSAAQLTQGKALDELPKLSSVLTQLNTTMQNVNTTMTALQREVSELTKGHYEMRGEIKSWRETAGVPRDRRRTE